MLFVIMKSVHFVYFNAECRYADCRYAECRGARLIHFERTEIISGQTFFSYGQTGDGFEPSSSGSFVECSTTVPMPLAEIRLKWQS